MGDLILKHYYEIYYNFILICCLIAFFHTLVLRGYENKVYRFNNVFGVFFLLTILCYIGLRPIDGKFVDMTTYAHTFQRYQNGAPVYVDGDFGFEYFVKFSSQIMAVETFFMLCAIIYIIPLYIASKRWFPKYYLFAFLFLVCSFSFLTYGTNGIRNGMATSLFILGLSYIRENHSKMIAILFLSFIFHKSMTLPILALATTFFLTDTKKYFMFWGLSIILSLVMGSLWIQLFASMGFGDERLSGYLTAEVDPSKFSSTGFRFDFLIYSAAPLALAYFYVIKKGFNDVVYKHILHTYIIANAFWVMVIRANFSNRFAYLSWFLMALVVAYPLFKNVFWNNHFKKVGIVLLVYYGFTYLMFYYYYQS